MHFQYLVCVKFHTTCWDHYRSRLNDVEIIEFSTLLLNTDGGLVESVFNRYVRPVHFPDLSDYCKSVTGLTQSFIDEQKSFKDVHAEFIHWLRENIMKYDLIFATPSNTFAPDGLNATFCTWSDWDLGHFFYRDCIRSGIHRYECLKAWIDLRRTYEHVQSKPGRRINFNEALAQAGIERKLGKRSCLENANDLAKLVNRLRSKGIQFILATSCSY